jgi:DNA (cytosine-5)-methyltransferase 1
MARVPTFVSLYTGAGGLDLGFALAGFRPVFANDIDADAVETYNRLFKRLADELPHLEDGHRAVAGDVRAVGELPAEGAADLLIGGPPCQGFSVAGRMDPNDPRSRHVWDFLGMVDRVKPRAFVMENVKSLAQNRRWSALLTRLREEAEGMGYVTQLHVLNASHFGVPQGRERMFLIGLLRGLEHHAPKPTTKDSPPTLRSVLAELPVWGELGNDTMCTAKVTPARNPVLRRSPFAGMLFNGQGRPMNLDAPAPTLPASMGGNRTPIVDQRQLSEGAECWVVAYHEHLMAGGAPHASIPGRLRRITVEEAAAIQTFPPEMDWAGPQSAKFRQIGNAVPPLMARSVALAVRRSMGERSFRPTSKRVLGLAIPR